MTMQMKLWYRHVRDTVVILEEFNLLHPRYSLCDMLVPWYSLNGLHWSIAQCKKGSGRKRQRLAEN